MSDPPFLLCLVLGSALWPLLIPAWLAYTTNARMRDLRKRLREERVIRERERAVALRLAEQEVERILQP